MAVQFSSYGAIRAFCQLTVLTYGIAAIPAHAADKLIVAFGDSLMAGYRLNPTESFPAQLEATLKRSGQAVRVHNAGVSGDTSAQGRARLGWVLASIKAKPDLVIVELGANDMLRAIDPAQTQANLSAILSDLKKRGIKVILAGMLASPNLGKAYQAKFNAVYPALARQYGVARYPFFMNGVTGNRALVQGDGLHPTARGVGVIVRGITPLVSHVLKP